MNGYLKKQYKFNETRGYDNANSAKKRVRYLKTGKVFESATEASEKTGYSISAISNMALGKKDPQLFEYA